MTRRTRWAAGVLGCGLLAGGTVLVVAAPAGGRPLFALALAGPYLLCGVACRREAESRLVRAAAVVVGLAGALLAAAVLADAAGDPAPAMPASALLAVPLLLTQYSAAVLALVWSLARVKTG